MQPEADLNNRRAEIEALLASDSTLLGRYWRYTTEGRTPQEMSELEGNSGTGWTSNYGTLLRVLRDGEVPSSPTLAQQGARKVRAWLNRLDLSDGLRAELIRQEQVLESRASDSKAQTAEVDGAAKASDAAEAKRTPGVYVYTLPHYVRHPVDAETGRTLLKVGHSSKDAIFRAKDQGRFTSLPEDPILLRVYPADESVAAERNFHEWLRSADHHNAPTVRAGKEWFLTSTKFLDHIANSQSLAINIISEIADFG